MRCIAMALAVLSLATVSAVAAPDLTAYEGKYGSDKVDGVNFLDNPAVLAGVGRIVADQEIRDTVLNPMTVQSPITVIDGVVRSDNCEPHNCGDHNWSILIEAATGAADVCYHDAATMPADQSRWYLASGKTAMRSGTCFE